MKKPPAQSVMSTRSGVQFVALAFCGFGVVAAGCGHSSADSTSQSTVDLGGRFQIPPPPVQAGGSGGTAGMPPEAAGAPPAVMPSAGAAGFGGSDIPITPPDPPPQPSSCWSAPEPTGPSETCGDSIRDPLLEECDAGADGNPACSSTCKALDFVSHGPVEPGAPRPARALGLGRHTASAGCSGFGFVLVDSTEASAPFVSAQALEPDGSFSGPPIRVTFGANPLIEANPVIAALPNGNYAVAWVDLGGDGDQRGILMRAVDFQKRFIGNLVVANEKTSFSQDWPDMVWVGQKLIVAWADGGDIRWREFSEELAPLSNETTLAGTADVEGQVSLTKFGDGWAAAWRVGMPGQEYIGVRIGDQEFQLGPFLPGRTGDRPAILELDSMRLLVVFSEGADPELLGNNVVPRLAAGIITLDGPSNPGFVSLHGAPADAFDAQSRPTLARAGHEAFLAWHAGSRGGALAEEVWLQAVSYDSNSNTVVLREPVPLPRQDAHRAGDQRDPMLVGSSAGDRVLALWNDHGSGFPSTTGIPRVAGALLSVPLLKLPEDLGVE